MKILILLLALLFSYTSFSQSGKGNATIQIKDDQNAPLESATVELLRSKDSGLVKTAITDKSGIGEFENIVPGNYFIRITSIGFNVGTTSLFQIIENQTTLVTPQTLTTKNTSALEGVTVSAKKPFIQMLSDRIVVNVENSVISAGSSALDVLERSPGVTIDGNDILALRGRQGVIIMIDGKPTPMSGAELVNYLRGLPVNAIERIELITNPSAKYEAAGNSGIIDIRMKKDQRLGTNGTLTLGYGQGVYPKANAGGTINYRNKKINVFGNYNYSYRELMNHLIINRNFYDNGVFEGGDNKDNFAYIPVKSNTVRIGADFFPSQNTTLGIVLNSNFNKLDRRADITTVVNNLQNIPYFKFVTVGTDDNNSGNIVANFNFRQKLNANGTELTADLDYGKFNSNSLTRTASSFYELNNTPKSEDDILDGDQSGRLSLRTAKVDFTNPIKSGGKIEAGFKTSLVSSDNNAKFFNVLRSGTIVDEAKTNRFFYDEYNHAGYLNFSREFKKLSVQLGLRGEQTIVNTRQIKGDKKFNNEYFQLFPSAFVTYKLGEQQTIGASVSRRIDRPNYSQLNPFLFQVDATIYSTGDPHLRPQTTWSYEMNYMVKNMNFTLGYSHTENTQNMVLSRILDVIPNFEIKPGQDSNITVQIPVNLISSDYFGLTATTPIKIATWWNMINNVNIFYNHFNGNLGGVSLNSGAPAVNLRTNNNFTFKKGWSSELGANFNSGGRYGYSVSKSQWGLSAGVQKTVMKGNGTIRFNITDIFWTSRPRSTITYEGRYVENWHAFRESRVANLNFTYRFGNNKVQQARKRNSASEEEIRRAGGN